MENKNTVLIIMDGFGLTSDMPQGNAIKIAGTPNLDKLRAQYPHGKLSASGLSVGLPDGQMGNSEVGHLNIGAGRVVYQDITRIDKSIEDGDFFKNAEFNAAIDNAKKNNTALHFMGLLSDGGVHSTINHLFALIKLAKLKGVDGNKVFVHCFMDGRDVSPTSGKGFIEALEKYMAAEKTGRIASVVGRYYIMDRDNRWERVAEGYNCLAAGAGVKACSAAKAVSESYEKGVTDEFIKPVTITGKDGASIGTIKENDSVIFFNFRSDRAREISRAFLYPDFNMFERAGGYKKVFYVGLTQYDVTFTGIRTAYKPQNLDNTFGEYISKNGKAQLRIAETEKYAHVTFFFNGGVEAPNAKEDRALVPSPKVATYDLQPEMSAFEVTDKVVAAINSLKYDAVILNFANCDMVGHTGIIPAAAKAVKTVDACVGRVVEAVIKTGGTALITADHGNAETMLMPDGSPCTAHTTNLVPFILAGDKYKGIKLREGGKLCDLAPTMLEIMGMNQPAEMTGQSLIKK